MSGLVVVALLASKVRADQMNCGPASKRSAFAPLQKLSAAEI
jgi:hypothetical protein